MHKTVHYCDEEGFCSSDLSFAIFLSRRAILRSFSSNFSLISSSSFVILSRSRRDLSDLLFIVDDLCGVDDIVAWCGFDSTVGWK